MSAESAGVGLDATLRDFASGQKVFNRYTLMRVLGRGGMGIVWLAHDEVLDRDVALKFLPEIIIHDRAVLEDLKRETKRSLELTHKNIIRIHDFVHDIISGCISMEYVEGDTLSNLRADKPAKIFEPDELKPWLNQLCEALDYAHNHARIIHRDLKPANLMINRRGDVKVADFGIARSLSDSVSMLTHARGTSGTLVYMSPQQLDGERGTHLDDIYSLGATVYELITSKPPFYSGNIDRQIREKIAPSMMQRRKDLEIEGNLIAKNWEDTVAACLAKDPAKRPQSVAEIANRLELISRKIDKGVELPIKRSKKKAVIVATLTVCLVAAVTWYFGIRARGEKVLRKPPFATTATSPKVAETEKYGPTLLTIGMGYKIKDDHRGNSIARLSAEHYGFVDEAGRVVVEPQWEEAFPFSEGLAAVRRNGKYGFIDKSGRVVVEPQWDTAWRFKEGLARVMRGGIPGGGVGGKWGFIDRAGRIIAEPQWDLVWDFSEGLAAVARGYSPSKDPGKWGYIDKSGTVVIELLYGSASPFSEGFAGVTLHNKRIFIDKTGHTVLDQGAVAFSEGLATFHVGLREGFIDKNGRTVIEPQWQQAFAFSEGVAAVKQNDKYGFIDTSGGVVIQPQFEGYRFAFSQGLASVKQNGKWGLIDKSGHFIVNPEWDLIDRYQEAKGAPFYWMVARQDGEKVNVEWLDATGKQIWSSTSPVSTSHASPSVAGELPHASPKVSADATEQAASTSLSAEKDFASAMEYWNGMNKVRIDEAKSVELMRRAANQHFPEAEAWLSYWTRNGAFDRNDPTKADQLAKQSLADGLEAAANSGRATAQVALGLLYQDGGGVTKDMSKAAEWYQKAADQGNADAQHYLAWMYQYADVYRTGVTKDLSKALELYRKATEQGDAHAQWNLAWTYQIGKGVTKDLTKAVELYQEAADQGLAAGQTTLGLMYRNGDGVIKDLSKAAEWYQKAANQGYVSAQVSLGELYENGTGVTKDLNKAMELYREAAESDDAPAREHLHRLEQSLSVTSATKTPGKIYVYGSVKSQGAQEIPTDESYTVSKVIAHAGGFGDFANKQKVKLTRKNGQEFTIDLKRVIEEGHTNEDMALQPDDQVYVPYLQSSPATSPVSATPKIEKRDANAAPENTKPRITYNPAPSYPPEARASKPALQGSGRFRVVFSASGDVKDVQTVQSTGQSVLDKAATTTLRRWRSEPHEGELKIIVPIGFEP